MWLILWRTVGRTLWESEVEYQDGHRSEFAFYHLVLKKHHETSKNSISPFLERDLYSNMLIRLKCMILKDLFMFFMLDSLLFHFFSIFLCSDHSNTWMQTWNEQKIIKNWMLALLLGCLHAQNLSFMSSQAKHVLLLTFIDFVFLFLHSFMFWSF